MANLLQVYSVFPSVDGECNDYGQGALTTFIRLAGCNLRCQYPCDTPNSLSMQAGEPMTIDMVLGQVMRWPIKKVTITGGEPLLQMDPLLLLIRELSVERGFDVSIETNGAVDPGKKLWDLFHFAGCLVVDYKLPSSGEEAAMCFPFGTLRPRDYCKFVILDRQDFDRALAVMNMWGKYPMKIAFSPVWGRLDPKTMVDWMMEAKIPRAILSVQLHKIIQLSEPQ